MKKLQIIVSAFAIVALLALPATAFAGSSGEEGYEGPNNVAGAVTGGGGGSTPTPTTETAAVVSESGSGELPFTGADLFVLVASGAALLGLGFGLRKLARGTH